MLIHIQFKPQVVGVAVDVNKFVRMLPDWLAACWFAGRFTGWFAGMFLTGLAGLAGLADLLGCLAWLAVCMSEKYKKIIKLTVLT